MNNQRKILIVALFLILISISICYIVYKNNNKNDNKIILNMTSLSLEVGDTKVIDISAEGINSNDINWESEDENVAMVDSNGNVTGIKEGKTYIKIEYGNEFNEKCEIIVTKKEETKTEVEDEKLILNKMVTTINVGDSENIDATIGEKQVDRDVLWISSNTEVVVVDNNGNIKGIKEGTSTITVETIDGNKTATCVVTVLKPTVNVTGVSLNKTSTKINVNATETLVATVSPSDATNKSVTWTSSDTSVATVNSNGVVTGKSAGTATITVKTNDGNKMASVKVTVVSAKIHFFKTGDADAILLESNGRYGLVDSGNNDGTVKKYLTSMGVTHLDFILATHNHGDHIGGVEYLGSFVNSTTKYYYRKTSNDSGIAVFTKAINAMNSKNVTFVEVTGKYPEFTLGEFNILLMNTEDVSADEKLNGTVVESNKNSIVAYVTYNGANGTLLTGDMESQDEYRIVSKLANKPVDVLKVAHHAWQSSTTMKFTKAISPKIAVVTGKYVLDDISTPVYYMQQKYGTKFYLTEKADTAVTIDYTNGLSVSPNKAIVENYRIKETSSKWRKLQNGIWFYIDSGNDLDTIVYDNWRYYQGKWYYLGLQGNMMTGFVETKYNGKANMYYLDKDGVMLTGWHQATGYGPYNNDKSSYYKNWIYSHENYLVKSWYQHNGTWADGKKWFYFEPGTGIMYHNVCKTINGKYYCFNQDGICTTGC